MTADGAYPGVFDVFGSLPTIERVAFEIRSWGSESGYSGLFRERWGALLGIPRPVIEQVAALPAEDFRDRAEELLAPHVRPAGEHVAAIRAAGVARTVVHNLLPTTPGLSNDDLGRYVREFPAELIGFVRIDPTTGVAAAEEIRRCVTTYGFRGVTMTPFWHRVRANDPALRPIYAACCELDIPIWIHTSVNWVRSAPLSLEHPLYLDEVASQFPGLKIIAGHGGWPWIADMVTVAWRQPNVYLDTSAFRPRHLGTPGTGWDMLWYFMSRSVQDKVLFGSTWSLLGMPLRDVIAEARSLALPPAVERKWLYANAARLLDTR